MSLCNAPGIGGPGDSIALEAEAYRGVVGSKLNDLEWLDETACDLLANRRSIIYCTLWGLFQIDTAQSDVEFMRTLRAHLKAAAEREASKEAA